MEINNYNLSVEKARTALGEKGKTMTDKQILDLLELLRVVCDKAIDSAIRNATLDKSSF